MRETPTAQPFSRCQAHQNGWTDPALTRAVRAGRLHRIRRGRFTSGDNDVDPRAIAIAAAGACSGSVISHASAALWHGLPLLRRPERPTVTVPPRGTGDLAGARTLIDLARHEATAAAVVPIHAALNRRLVLGWLRWPPATLQQRIGGPTGEFIGRLDFYWDDLGIGGEADGDPRNTATGRPCSTTRSAVRTSSRTPDWSSSGGGGRT